MSCLCQSNIQSLLIENLGEMNAINIRLITIFNLFFPDRSENMIRMANEISGNVKSFEQPVTSCNIGSYSSLGTFLTDVNLVSVL